MKLNRLQNAVVALGGIAVILQLLWVPTRIVAVYTTVYGGGYEWLFSSHSIDFARLFLGHALTVFATGFLVWLFRKPTT